LYLHLQKKSNFHGIPVKKKRFFRRNGEKPQIGGKNSPDNCYMLKFVVKIGQ